MSGQGGRDVRFLQGSVLKRLAGLISPLKLCVSQYVGVGMMFLSVILLQQKRRSGPSGR